MIYSLATTVVCFDLTFHLSCYAEHSWDFEKHSFEVSNFHFALTAFFLSFWLPSNSIPYLTTFNPHFFFPIFLSPVSSPNIHAFFSYFNCLSLGRPSG